MVERSRRERGSWPPTFGKIGQLDDGIRRLGHRRVHAGLSSDFGRSIDPPACEASAAWIGTSRWQVMFDWAWHNEGVSAQWCTKFNTGRFPELALSLGTSFIRHEHLSILLVAASRDWLRG